jgi:hypothetical protein
MTKGQSFRNALCLGVAGFIVAVLIGRHVGPELIGKMAVDKVASDVTEVVSVVRMATDSRGNPVPPYLADVSPVRR